MLLFILHFFQQTYSFRMLQGLRFYMCREIYIFFQSVCRHIKSCVGHLIAQYGWVESDSFAKLNRKKQIENLCPLNFLNVLLKYFFYLKAFIPWKIYSLWYRKIALIENIHNFRSRVHSARLLCSCIWCRFLNFC